MANGKNQPELSEQQIFLTGALSEIPKSISELQAQMESDGYLDTMTKPQVEKLKKLGYAKIVRDDLDNVVGLKRGLQWQEFDEKHGLYLTRKGFDNWHILEIMSSFSEGIDLTEC